MSSEQLLQMLERVVNQGTMARKVDKIATDIDELRNAAREHEKRLCLVTRSSRPMMLQSMNSALRSRLPRTLGLAPRPALPATLVGPTSSASRRARSERGS